MTDFFEFLKTPTGSIDDEYAESAKSLNESFQSISKREEESDFLTLNDNILPNPFLEDSFSQE